ncbi:hypothetical protein [Nannocystis pusilla]|uniref:hypothetical protein n=1 Tax=Nannocystis pusilla TaxID=889268 RepID=UPI003DA68B65
MARLLRAALLLALAGGCRPDGALAQDVVDVTPPAGEVYPEGASDFTGEWVGESAGIFGTLTIQRLASDRYYGRFTSEDGLIRFVCNLRQIRATPPEGGAMLPSNLVTFHWQDGRGGRGGGYVLINRESSALTGEIRYGGLGTLDFVRTDAPDMEAPADAETADAFADELDEQAG